MKSQSIKHINSRKLSVTPVPSASRDSKNTCDFFARPSSRRSIRGCPNSFFSHKSRDFRNMFAENSKYNLFIKSPLTPSK